MRLWSSRPQVQVRRVTNERGFCGKCVQEMREELENLMTIYTPLADEYERYTHELSSQNVREKAGLLERKIADYETRVREHRQLDPQRAHQKTAENEIYQEKQSYRKKITILETEVGEVV